MLCSNRWFGDWRCAPLVSHWEGTWIKTSLKRELWRRWWVDSFGIRSFLTIFSEWWNQRSVTWPCKGMGKRQYLTKTLIRGSHKQHHFVGGKKREYGCCYSLKDESEVIYLKRFRGTLQSSKENWACKGIISSVTVCKQFPRMIKCLAPRKADSTLANSSICQYKRTISILCPITATSVP